MVVADETKIQKLDKVVQECLANMELYLDVDLNLVDYEQCVCDVRCLHRMVFTARNGEIALFVDFSYHRHEGKKLEFSWKSNTNYWEEGSKIKQDIPGVWRPWAEWPSDVDLTKLATNALFERIIPCKDVELVDKPTKVGTIMTNVINSLKARNCSLCKEYSHFV